MKIYEEESTWKTIQSFLSEYNRIKNEKQYVLLSGGGHFTIEKEMLKQQENYFIEFMDRKINNQ